MRIRWRDREKALVLCAHGADAVGTLAFTKVLAISLTKSEMGAYMLAASALALMLLIFSTIDQGFFRGIVGYETNGTLKRRYTALLVGYSTVAMVLPWALLPASRVAGRLAHSGGDHRFPAPYVVLFSCWLFMEALKNVSTSTANVLRRRLDYTLAKFVEQGAKLLLLLVAVRYAPPVGAKTVILILAGTAGAVAAFSLVRQRGLWGQCSRADFAVFGDSARFVWPLFIWGAFTWMHNMSGRWVLAWFLDDVTVANFGILASTATVPVTLLLGVIGTYALPIIYRREDEVPGSAWNYIARLVKMLAPAMVVGVVVAAIFPAQIIRAISSAAYTGYARYLPYMVAATALNAAGSVVAYNAFASRKTNRLLVANIVPGVASLASAIYLVPRYGIRGAVMAFIVAHALFFTLHMRVFWGARAQQHQGAVFVNT